MPSAAAIMAELKKKGSAQTRKIYARHGNTTPNMFGVSMADLKVIAKKIKGQQALACELYATGNMDAMYLAGLVASGAQMSTKQLNEWADGAAGLQMIAEYTVPSVAVENAQARDLAMRWIKSKNEQVASCGWCTYAGIVGTQADDDLGPRGNRAVSRDGGQGNPWRAKPRSLHHEWFCHRRRKLRASVGERGESVGPADRPRFGGHGRDILQCSARHCVHREGRGGRPDRSKTKDDSLLAGKPRQSLHRSGDSSALKSSTLLAQV